MCCGNHDSGHAIIRKASSWSNSANDAGDTWSIKLFLCDGTTYNGRIVAIEDHYFTFQTDAAYREWTRYDIPYTCVARIKRYESAE
jgi:small nuclear ribonucleoprotein (snRNP)-like protein